MKKSIELFVVLLVIMFASHIFAQNDSWLNEINKFANDQNISDDSLYTILSQWNAYPAPDSTGVFITFYNQINDTLKAPYVLYIPSEYDQHTKTPLLVYLHGGVSTRDFHSIEESFLQDNYFVLFAEKHKWLMLFPFGNIDTSWWDLVGVKNIQTQIRILKTYFNIDDDRIFVTGFSDGGSGSFFMAMSTPDDFASFYPLNGFLSVGSIVTKKPTFLPNLKNRRMNAINTDIDRLYPALKMRMLIDLALQAGANLLYKEYWGVGHDFDYANDEIPIMIKSMTLQPREIFQPDIYWETWTPDYGKCDWLEILEIDTTIARADWHQEYQAQIPNDRISFGFYPDDDFDYDGIIVYNLVEGETTASQMGLQQQDLIIKMDGIPIHSLDEMDSLKTFKQRGDSVSITVKRYDEEITLYGQFPDTTYYDAINYSEPSGAVQAEYFGNEFVLETSRVKKLAIYLHPDMVNFDNPVKVIINNKVVFDKNITIDRELMIDNFLRNRDRSALWAKRLEFEI
ncbi:MAG: PDZ domain-containing protein [Candidatus Cloacimonetes bacterium]|nr:PDZ domain-containing protein [Candidatus Cloacimonadota bacterium]